MNPAKMQPAAANRKQNCKCQKTKNRGKLYISSSGVAENGGGLKPDSFYGVYGTDKSVPFQSREIFSGLL